jgi:HemY protein
MKKLGLWLIFCGAVAVILFYAPKDAGYMMIAYHHWVIATSFWVGIISLFVLFLVLHYFLRVVHFFSAIPKRMRQRKTITRAKKLQSLLSQGIIFRLLGNHKKAEKFFVKAAGLADDPASMYLLAAQSANVLHEIERREKYLLMAVAQRPDYESAALQIRAK